MWRTDVPAMSTSSTTTTTGAFAESAAIHRAAPLQHVLVAEHAPHRFARDQ